MVEIPDSLCSVFTATLDENYGSVVFEVPSDEIEYAAVAPGATYRVAILDTSQKPDSTLRAGQSASQERDEPRQPPAPAVEEGERREVTVESSAARVTASRRSNGAMS